MSTDATPTLPKSMKHGPDCTCGCQTLSSIEDLSEIFTLHNTPTYKVAAMHAVHLAGIAAAAAYFTEAKLVKLKIEYEEAQAEAAKMTEKLDRMHQSIKVLQADLAQIVEAAEATDEEATLAVAAAADAVAAETKLQIITADLVVADADASIAVALADDVATHWSEISKDAKENMVELADQSESDVDAAAAAAEEAVDAAAEIRFQVAEAKLESENYIENTMSSFRNAIKSSDLAGVNYCPDDDGIEKNIHKSELPDRLQLLRHQLFLSNKLYGKTWALFTQSKHGLVDAIKSLFGEWGATA